MRSLYAVWFGVGFVSIFSVSLFFAGDVFSMWLIMELAAISLVPCFFCCSNKDAYLPLFSYVLMSSLSSSLIVSGFLFESCVFLTYCGLIMKFGVFPFMGWVYLVFTSANWFVIWGLSTVLKAPFLAIFFYLGFVPQMSVFTSFCCAVTLILVSLLFWVYSFSWEHYWCHVALSSSAVFLLMASCCVPVNNLVAMFTVYVGWSTLSILLISRLSFSTHLSSTFFFGFLCMMIACPVSLSVLYKLYISLHVYSCGWWFLLFWAVCSISEQFYLLKFLFSGSVSFKDWGGSLLV